MKKILLLLIAGFSMPAFTQTPIDFDYKDKKVVFPAIKKELTKEDKYAIFMPSKLTYFVSQDDILKETWNPYVNYIEIKAKGHQVKYDYRFEVIAPGVQNVTLQGMDWFKTEVADQNGIPREVKGFVRNYTANFPCALVVKDASGQLLDSIVISNGSDVYTATLHKDFLQSSNTSPKPTIPFNSQEEITRLEATNKNMIDKKVEATVARQVFQKISLAITYLFKNYNTGKQVYGFGFVKAKGGPSNLPEVDKIVNDYKIALDSLSEGNYQLCSTICAGNKVIMENLISTNDARLDKNAKQMLYYNLSHASLLTNQFEDAWKYYKLFIESGVAERSRMAGELRNRISTHEFYDKIKRQVKTKPALAYG